jgi:hypothetical protein
MSNKTHEWMQHFKAVELEYRATRLATDRLIAAVRRDATVLSADPDIRVRDIREASRNLEGTYIVRLFAEFETGLRRFWPSAKRTEPPSRTRDLLDGVAAARSIENDRVKNAHAVREYRNRLLHERDEDVTPVSISEARSHLMRYFGFLPPIW